MKEIRTIAKGYESPQGGTTEVSVTMPKRLVPVALVLFLAAGQTAAAQESLVDMVLDACETEVTTYCDNVNVGDGRMLACFYAHEDKLSVGCLNALYDGIVVLELYVQTLSYVANQCVDDIDAICANTVPGEGRIAQCLLDNKADLTAYCSNAIDATGLGVN